MRGFTVQISEVPVIWRSIPPLEIFLAKNTTSEGGLTPVDTILLGYPHRLVMFWGVCHSVNTLPFARFRVLKSF